MMERPLHVGAAIEMAPLVHAFQMRIRDMKVIM